MSASSIPTMRPSAEDMALARESGRVLSAVLNARAHIQKIDVHDDQGAVHTISVPTAVLRLLQEVLTEIGQGHAVSLIPIHMELTTQEAADLLNVSRPFLIQQLEKGDIPFHKIGTHRRVRYPDVIDYKKRLDAQRSQTREDLATQTQERGLEY